MLGHSEVRVMDYAARRHPHGGVIEGAAENNSYAGRAEEPDERIIGCHLRIVAIGVGLGEPVQLQAVQTKRSPRMQVSRDVRDPRTPGRVRPARRSVHFDRASAVGVEHVTARQEQQTRVICRFGGRTGWTGLGMEDGTVKLEEMRRRS